MKFGTVSVREVYHTFVKELGKSNGLVKQLLRDFYYNLVYHFPETFTKKVGLKDIYETFPGQKINLNSKNGVMEKLISHC